MVDPAGDPAHRSLDGDPGVQLERTALARHRTMLASAMVGLVLALVAVRAQLWGVVVAAAVVAAAAVTLPLRFRAPTARDARLHRWPYLASTATLVTVLAALGAVTALVAALPGTLGPG